MYVTASSISFDEIDFNDISYKISKPHISAQLIHSIKKYGVLEEPVLIRENNRFLILSGHNRLSVMKDLGENRQQCIILESFNPHLFFQIALKKLYHAEIGPLGKIKLCRIIKKYESDLSIRFTDFAIQELGVPESILYSEERMIKALSFPPLLAGFLEIKEPGFKTIKDLIDLSEHALAILNNWLEAVPMRVNIFRQVIELLHDIERKEYALQNIQHSPMLPEGEPRYKEAFLINQLMSIRYPNYSMRKAEADILLEALKKNGIYTTFPEFFESDEVGFNIKIRKRDGSESLFNKIGKIDKNIVKKLLDLL